MGNKHKFHENKFAGSKMKEDNKKTEAETPEYIEEVAPEETSAPEPEKAEAQEEVAEKAADACENLETKVEELQAALEKEKKEYHFLLAEFDNFRKRTLKEKSEIIKNAGENVFKGLLPIIDDFERGLKAAENTTDSDSVKEGLNLIYNKLVKYLNQNGVKEFDPSDDTFDTEKHEAISVVPVPDEDKKGKILDTVEKGYTINDKVLRHAKVVVAQ